MKSKTQRALALIDGGVLPYQAAKQLKMSTSTLYKALSKRREREARGTCPHCGQTLPKRS